MHGDKKTMEMKDNARALFQGVIDGNIDLPENALVFLDYETLTSVVTPKRLELLETIGKKHPSSVNELAALTGRLKQAVVRDLKYLEMRGIIGLARQGRMVTPTLKRSVFLFSLGGFPLVKPSHKARQSA